MEAGLIFIIIGLLIYIIILQVKTPAPVDNGIRMPGLLGGIISSILNIRPKSFAGGKEILAFLF